jgi:hypothetical protein
LESAVLHLDNDEPNDAHNNEDTDDGAYDSHYDAAGALLVLSLTIFVIDIGVSIALGSDFLNRGINTIDGKAGVFVVHDNIEVLHENVSQDVLSRVDLISVDSDLANVQSIAVSILDQIVLRLKDISSITDEVEAKA